MYRAINRSTELVVDSLKEKKKKKYLNNNIPY